MCCAIDGKNHCGPMREDGSCMHCDKVPGPNDTIAPPPKVPTIEEVQAAIAAMEPHAPPRDVGMNE